MKENGQKERAVRAQVLAEVARSSPADTLAGLSPGDTLPERYISPPESRGVRAKEPDPAALLEEILTGNSRHVRKLLYALLKKHPEIAGMVANHPEVKRLVRAEANAGASIDAIKDLLGEPKGYMVPTRGELAGIVNDEFIAEGEETAFPIPPCTAEQLARDNVELQAWREGDGSADRQAANRRRIRELEDGIKTLRRERNGWATVAGTLGVGSLAFGLMQGRAKQESPPRPEQSPPPKVAPAEPGKHWSAGIRGEQETRALSGNTPGDSTSRKR